MAGKAERPVWVVIGVGPGVGAALARRFASDHAVASVARGDDKLGAWPRKATAQAGPW